MTSLLTSLHFWTVRPLAGESGQLLGVHSYHDKGSESDDLSAELRRQWAEGRGVTWTPKNKRPEKLRDTIKDCEELLSIHRVIHVHWKTSTSCQIILQNGIVLHFGLASHSGDIDRLIIDRTLVGRVGGQTEALYDGVFSNSGALIALSFLDKPRIALVYISKRATSQAAGILTERLEKLSTHGDIRVNYIDLPSNAGRRIERRLSINKTADLLAVWWPLMAEEAWPWANMVKPTEKRLNASNLLLFTLGSKVELLWHTRTDSSPVNIQFSGRETYHLLTVEGGMATSGDGSTCTADVCVYEFGSGHKVEKVLSYKVDLPGAMVTHALSHDESRLACACSNGQLILHDNHRSKVLSRSLVMPQVVTIKWHPSDTVLMVASSKGDIQVFDLALSLIFIQLHSETGYQQETLDVAAFLQGAPRLSMCHWSTPALDNMSAVTMETVMGPSSHQNLLLVFDKGPMCNVCFQLGAISRGLLGPLQLMCEYITHRQIPAAIALLQHMDWNRQAKTAFSAMTMVIDHLLRMPLSAESEAFMEEALGSFLAPPRPLVQNIQMQYRNRINNLVRRFFHQLIRYRKFEKAFLLAEDIGARDLFMDLHYLAVDGGEKSLAELAKHRAENIDSDEVDGGSLESLEGVEVDSDLSSSAPSRGASQTNVDESGVTPTSQAEMSLADELDGGAGAGAGSSDGMQLELSMSGSDGEFEDLFDELGIVDDDFVYVKDHHQARQEAMLASASADGLAESELTLRATGGSSLGNVRDDSVGVATGGPFSIPHMEVTGAVGGDDQSVSLQGSWQQLHAAATAAGGMASAMPGYLADDPLGTSKPGSAHGSARNSPSSRHHSRSATPGIGGRVASPTSPREQDAKVVNVGLV